MVVVVAIAVGSLSSGFVSGTQRARQKSLSRKKLQKPIAMSHDHDLLIV